MAKKVNYSKDGKTKITNFGTGKDRISVFESTNGKTKPASFDHKKQLK